MSTKTGPSGNGVVKGRRSAAKTLPARLIEKAALHSDEIPDVPAGCTLRDDIAQQAWLDHTTARLLEDWTTSQLRLVVQICDLGGNIQEQSGVLEEEDHAFIDKHGKVYANPRIGIITGYQMRMCSLITRLELFGRPGKSSGAQAAAARRVANGKKNDDGNSVNSLLARRH